MKEKCSLMLCLNVYPWCKEPYEHELKTGTLSELDSFTLKFLDKFQLFASFKDEVLAKISNKYLKEHGIMPIDIELTGNGVYVVKNGEAKQALFNNIIYDDKTYPLESIVLSTMLKGSLDAFYQCDKKRSSSIIYDSFFDKDLRFVAERLEVGSPKQSDYLYVYRNILNTKRFCEVLRFLLIDPRKYDFDELYQIYVEDIPEVEEEVSIPDTSKSHNDKETRNYYYRYPYKDD